MYRGFIEQNNSALINTKMYVQNYMWEHGWTFSKHSFESNHVLDPLSQNLKKRHVFEFWITSHEITDVFKSSLHLIDGKFQNFIFLL